MLKSIYINVNPSDKHDLTFSPCREFEVQLTGQSAPLSSNKQGESQFDQWNYGFPLDKWRYKIHWQTEWRALTRTVRGQTVGVSVQCTTSRNWRRAQCIVTAGTTIYWERDHTNDNDIAEHFFFFIISAYLAIGFSLCTGWII